MPPLRHKIAAWLFSTSIFAAFCALALCMATEKLALHKMPVLLSPLHLLVVGSTMLEYNAHALFNQFYMQMSRWSPYGRGTRMTLAIIGLAMATVGIFSVAWPVIACCAFLGILSLTYSAPILPFKFKKRLKDFGWIKIFVLTSVWVMVTTVLPIVYLDKSLVSFLPEIVLRFLLVFPLCLAFDIRDMKQDGRQDIHTLPNTIGLGATYRLSDVSLLLFIGLGIWINFHAPSQQHLAAVIITAIATKIAILISRKKPFPFVYLFLIDGMMLLYGLLLLF